jgi:hypothetical protein
MPGFTVFWEAKHHGPETAPLFLRAFSMFFSLIKQMYLFAGKAG